MSTSINPYLAQEKQGLAVIGDYAGAANNKAMVQVLIDIMEPESTTVYRGMLADIQTVAHRQMLVELDALYAAVV